ncbi:uncharacterized protein LOC123870481 [Maniola jurtina]|uniref:uncharacterized protein LOC123870481 n=1 Tax=Maniola jurtina TaxID=191418 RepID=UPI001E688997|nr:uncharacterized protein LOC123870481 [Maniola jurtina]
MGVSTRALLDSGSQGSLISTDLVGRLGICLDPCSERIMGVGGIETTSTIIGRSSVTFSPINKRFPKITTPVLCMQTVIGKLPTVTLDDSVKDLATGLSLADPHFHQSSPVELLLGSDVLGSLMGGDKIILNSIGLTAYNTIFGYVLLGPVELTKQSELIDDSEVVGISVSDTLQKFWEVEEPPETSSRSAPLDLECEQFYKDSTYRLENGRFVTKLPFLPNRPLLGDSKTIAEKRFLALERKLMKNSVLREKYINFMREYLDLGHMSVSDFDFKGGQEYFVIPHHAVFKDSDENAKVRVVFDGSCVTNSGVSLNQCLHSGPKLQRDISEILMNFRRHRVVFVTDIRMMFRQTLIDKLDRRYQLIFWRESPDEPLLTYELGTNTYGLKSSPYIAIRTLLELADRERDRYPRAASVLENDIYVDDILSGCSSQSEALELQQELIRLMQSGGYELRKWISNDPVLLRDLPDDHQQVPHLFDNPDMQSLTSVLGVQYNPVEDVFSFRTDLTHGPSVTKRKILSTIARMYDPSGWITPVLFRAKCFLQRLWLSGFTWDEPITGDLERDWINFKIDLARIEDVRISRCMLPPAVKNITMHGFSDASEAGYAAVVYLRAVDDTDNVSVHLVMAKSKVAPIRTRLTIPKLELCGAVLLLKLLHHVCLCLQRTIDVHEVFGWTDSSIVLAWLKTSPHTLQVFEANRVSQIQNSTVPITWRHIPGELNPADCASRGLTASGLVSHPLWWGPRWLTYSESVWPASKANQVSPADLPGIRCSVATNSESLPDFGFLVERYSSLDRLISVTAWIRRFIFNCRRNNNRNTTPYLTTQDRKHALLMWISLVQRDSFGAEIEKVRKGQTLKGHLRRLNPFIDSDGLLRVGGRLQHSDLPYEARHPLLLPKSGHFIDLLISDSHLKNSHVGPNALLAILQRDYWILSARRAVRKITFKCISCYKLKGLTTQPLMGDLPKDRVLAARPFQGVGTDFAGPFYVKSHKLRNPKVTKAYLCVFVCLATKSVHLELVSDLSSEAFIACLSRMTSRRGFPAIIRSDCGSNYKSSDRYLKEVFQFLEQNRSQIGHDLARRGITWLFDPPACPSWGGLFEAAVKSAKTHLKRTIGETTLTFEELSTVFCKIEAVLNSRPLCPLSSDPNDLEVLTPGHFLIGQPLTALPEYPFQDEKTYKLSRFQLLQQLSQRIWHRWHLEYLHTLQQRLKWTDPAVPPKVGDLVLLKEDNAPPLQWRRGRIVALYPGKDGVVRLADVRVAKGTVLQRAISKLSRLPLD